jgi:hypothetical protein
MVEIRIRKTRKETAEKTEQRRKAAASPLVREFEAANKPSSETVGWSERLKRAVGFYSE